MDKVNFNEMAAYEFSALSQQNPQGLSKVTVLDCKHCNDPFYNPQTMDLKKAS